MKDERMSVSGVGAGSLLTVLAVLCLVVFTVLSISTVQSQKALSERSAAAVEAYYQADARAEERSRKKCGERGISSGMTSLFPIHSDWKWRFW